MEDPRGTADTVLVESPASTSSEDAALQTTLIANRYHVEALVGRGGMGAVYRVHDRRLDEVVALKMLRRELVGSGDALGRFVQEVKLARRVTHANVARTFDIGEHEIHHFLTMEWIAGESLARRLERQGALPIAEGLRIVGSICDGVQAAHAVGVVHRDLKPDNVMLEEGGRVVVTDFGIARTASSADRTEGIVGTPAYMAPEQLEGKRATPASDVYAIGEILYEVCTGARAYPVHQPFLVAVAKLRDAPPDPRARAPVPDELADLILRCLDRDPSLRPARAAELAAELRAIGPTDGGSLRAAARRERSAAISLAVRPFRNGGPAEDQEIAHGLAEDVLDTLSTVQGLRVRLAPASPEDSRTLGRALGVDVVLEGTLRRDEVDARFSARVVSVEDGFQVWARRFAAPKERLLAVADEAAQAVAEALATRLLAPPRPALDPLALDAYLRGREVLRRTWYFPIEGRSRAIDLFEEAIARAPDEPSFLAASAITLLRIRNDEESGALALSRARRATELAPHLAEGWWALATVQAGWGDFVASVRSAAEAHRRGPSLAEPLSFIGGLYDEIGPTPTARHYLERALVLDPDTSSAAAPLARSALLQGDLEGARRLLRSENPDGARIRLGAQLRFATWSKDRTWVPADAPLDEFRSFPVTAWMAQWYETGSVDFATEDARLAEFSGRSLGRLARFLAQVRVELAAFVGAPTAFDVLRACVDGGTVDLMWLDHAPVFDGMRADPRWAPLRAIVFERAELLRAELVREGLS